jgi:hypothetical protein
VLNGEGHEVSVRVKSDFRTGSFQIDLEVLQTVLETVKDLLSIHKQGVDAKTLLGYLGFSIGPTIGLLKLIKLLRGRKIESTTTLESGSTSIVVTGDQNTIKVNQNTLILYNDRNVRSDVQNLLKPLDDPDIEKFEVREETRVVDVVTKEERGYFSAPEIPVEELVDNEFTGAYTIVTAAFDEHLKWRLAQGETRITASLQDAGFINGINNGDVSFFKGDVLLVKMRLRQWEGPEGLKSEYDIVEVLEHRKRGIATQIPFLLPPEGEGTDSTQDE